jgi:hypothetical protein
MPRRGRAGVSPRAGVSRTDRIGSVPGICRTDSIGRITRRRTRLLISLLRGVLRPLLRRPILRSGLGPGLWMILRSCLRLRGLSVPRRRLTRRAAVRMLRPRARQTQYQNRRSQSGAAETHRLGHSGHLLFSQFEPDPTPPSRFLVPSPLVPISLFLFPVP